jgi:NCS1 family nucleobase:cation symporter-1
MVPLGTIVVALIGIVCTSCAAQIFPEQNGTLLWQPYTLLSALQEHYNHSSRSRAAVAFGSLSFGVAQFGMVVANNGLASGLDLSALFPRYFTIRRGMLLMCVISFIVQPWELLNGASKFITVLSGYGVFIGPMMGVMYADYFLVRSRLLKLVDLYDYNSSSVYWYWKGMNWRALVAWAMGVWITIPGFAEFVEHGTAKELKGWSNLYYLQFVLGCILSTSLYYLLHRVSPIKGLGEVDDADYFGTFGPAQTVVDGEAVDVEVDSGMEEVTVDSMKKV